MQKGHSREMHSSLLAFMKDMTLVPYMPKTSKAE